MTKTPLYDSLFPEKYADDDFGYSQDWKVEIEKWLKCASKINYQIYQKQQKRVIRSKQRDELLGEYKAMYLANNNWQMKKMRFTDEEKAQEKTVDFKFKDHDNKEWFAEVKSPSWEAELAEDYKNGRITLKQFQERKKLPQFINGEGRWLGFDIFRNPISDTLKKIKVGNNNILFICPNTFGPHGLLGEMEDWYKLRKIVSELDVNQKLSAICFLEINLYQEGFKYVDQLVNLKQIPKLSSN